MAGVTVKHVLLLCLQQSRWCRMLFRKLEEMEETEFSLVTLPSQGFSQVVVASSIKVVMHNRREPLLLQENVISFDCVGFDIGLFSTVSEDKNKLHRYMEVSGSKEQQDCCVFVFDRLHSRV